LETVSEDVEEIAAWSINACGWLIVTESLAHAVP
jgi:hypothetical protein